MGRKLEDSHMGPIEATHKIKWLGVRFYLHDPSHTIWGCNPLTEYLLEVGFYDWAFQTTVAFGMMLLPGWDAPRGFHYEVIETFEQE